ncbi:MAG: DNA/RNA nuclease SfsA [Clostridiales bacterium]|nr:DNA/RNA nuclease SfsA [Clostridiales bacterium]
MKYHHIEQGIFVSRPNRFIAKVLLHGEETLCHVKNTGRCKEILIPGVKVLVDKATNPNRKTGYDLIGAYKEKMLINIDSQAPNQVVEEWLKEGRMFPNFQKMKREVSYGHSRFDFWIKDQNGQEHFMEVKGVTLEKHAMAFFPDAPTLRGIKHIEQLVQAQEKGYQSHLFFVIQLKGVEGFSPNDETHQAFGETLRWAAKQGVSIYVKDCMVTENTLAIDQDVPLLL